MIALAAMGPSRQTKDRGSRAGDPVLPIFALGFLAIATQTIFLRECLSVFHGNELVIGIVLFNWMVLTGVGALLGGYFFHRMTDSVVPLGLLLLLAVVSPAIVFGVTAVRAVLFPAGILLGIVEALSISALVLAPFAVLSGCSFTLWASIGPRRNSAGYVARLYSLESLGSVAGGVIFNILLIFVLSTFQALAVLSLLVLIVVAVSALRWKKHLLGAVSVVAAVMVLATACTIDLDRLTRQMLFPHQRLLGFRDTPYGQLSVTRSAEQLSFFDNDVLLGSTHDPISAEEAAHYALVQHPRPRKVLLVGGGLSGVIQEILKYDVDRIVWVEIDPAVIAVGREYTDALADTRVHPVVTDARQFVRKSAETFDAALVNLPDPSSAQLNRFYTVEFLQELHSRLAPGAVVALSLTSSGDYQSGEARRLISVVVATLKNVFTSVLIVPGTRNYLLASERPLTPRIASLLAERGIMTNYVSGAYTDDESMVRRSAILHAELDPSAPVNRDFMPVAYRRQLDYWSTLFGFDPMLIAGILVIAAVLVVGRLNAVSFGLFAAGCAASSLECVILLSFQIICGYVYQALGLIVTVFMAGLAAGSFLGRRRPFHVGMGWYAGVQCAVAGSAFLLILLILGSRLLSPHVPIVYAVFGTLTFIIGALIGLQFALATRLSAGTTASIASRLYGIDLVGSALGALLVCAFLVPLLGIHRVTIAVALLMLASAGISIAGRKKALVRSAEV